MRFHQSSQQSLTSIVLLLHLSLFFSIMPQWSQANGSTSNETDQLSLLKIKEMITSDPRGILNSWNDSIPFCKWSGILCSRRHQRVISLDLQEQKLSGSIAPHIGNLSFLKFIYLQNNSLRGEIPQQVGKLFRLEVLALYNNALEGRIPVNFSSCSRLRIIRLSRNYLVGKIPAELGNFPMLESLRMGKNNLTGEIPPSLGNISSLVSFNVAENNFYGNIPLAISQLTRLAVFSVASNHLSGTIPSSFFNLSSLEIFSVAANNLHGNLPDSMGLNLQNLQHLTIGGNKFSGTIPSSLANASQFAVLDINGNNFVGHVATNLGNLHRLHFFVLEDNFLGNDSTNDLDFLISLQNCTNLETLSLSSNNFGGVLPNSVGNLSTELRYFYIGDNKVKGTIPTLENLVNLIALGLEDNYFHGSFPIFFGNLPSLQLLALGSNKLSGQVPSTVGNLTHLVILYAPSNNFQGQIPSSIANCQNLYYLDLSSNNLSGDIPQEILGLSSLSMVLSISQNSLSGILPAKVGKLTNLNTLNVSENNFFGEIPGTIGDCLALEFLYMQGNAFSGVIPSSLASLRGLKEVDLSRNNLTGEIPKEFLNMTYLSYLNISFNDLEGEVPTRGIFSNASALSLVGNIKLCGGISELRLPKCPMNGVKKHMSIGLKLTIIITCLIVCTILVAIIMVSSLKREPEVMSGLPTLTLGQFKNISYRSLHQATNGFSSGNFIGSGSFGSVYKGLLNEMEKIVAIKVLNLQQKGASKSIAAECITLRHIRHRNLVKLLTFCSSLEFKGNEFKALVFEFMPNGSLERWLHPDPESENQPIYLNFLQRLNILIDVASALHYLHDLCERPIIHCDLKPSNVLLDDDMVAHVSDFGLARFLMTTDLSHSNTSTIGLKGTIGYAAPEYGIGGAASKEGDVYSFGILVLEMFSGRKPTDDMFKDGLNLHDYAKLALPERVMNVLDPTLPRGDIEAMEDAATRGQHGVTNHEMHEEQRTYSVVEKRLISILEIGVACSVESPKKRANIVEVTRQLHSIKTALLRNHVR